MSHRVLKPEPKPKASSMESFYDATESLWASVKRSLNTNHPSKAKKYERGLFY